MSIKSFFSFLILLSLFFFGKAQTTAMQFSGQDCNGNSVDLFADLDAGKVVILHFFMPNCGSCPPPAQKIQAMADHINATHPGLVRGYAFPFQNSTTCAYSSSWVSSNNLSSLYAPMDSGAAHVAHYGGFGMPTVVVLGGNDHRVLFVTLSFSTSDTTEMRDSILALLDVPSATIENSNVIVEPMLLSNPANTELGLEMNLTSDAEVEFSVLDMSGREMMMFPTRHLPQGATQLWFNVAALPVGSYLLQMSASGNTLARQFAIQR